MRTKILDQLKSASLVLPGEASSGLSFSRELCFVCREVGQRKGGGEKKEKKPIQELGVQRTKQVKCVFVG